MESAEFMIDTTAGHQGTIEMFWLHFSWAVVSFIFIDSLLDLLAGCEQYWAEAEQNCTVGDNGNVATMSDAFIINNN